MLDNIPEITNAQEFRTRVIQSDRPVVVEFFSPTCPNCRKFEPTMQSLMQEFSDRMAFLKVDCDKSPELEELYMIRVTPTIFLFVDGAIARRWDNDQERANYRQVFEGVLAHR